MHVPSVSTFACSLIVKQGGSHGGLGGCRRGQERERIQIMTRERLILVGEREGLRSFLSELRSLSA